MPVSIALEKLADIVVTGHSASRNACLANCRPVVPLLSFPPPTVRPIAFHPAPRETRSSFSFVPTELHLQIELILSPFYILFTNICVISSTVSC